MTYTDPTKPEDAGRRLPGWMEPPYRDIQMTIGEGLKTRYEPPKELPHRLLTLLIQMDERWEDG